MDQTSASAINFQELAELNVHIGDILGDSHEVMSIIGEGGFGFVTKCRNVKSGDLEAVKISKNEPKIMQQTNQEITILRRLQFLDPDACHIVRWKEFFFHGENICLNFELLDESLFDYIVNREKGLSISEARTVLHQTTTALCHLHSIGIIHADIKPDNVMIVNCGQQPLSVKLIDFGLAYLIGGEPGVSVQTIGYRAPEVMLDMPFNEAIDIWSLGVLAAEAVTVCNLYYAREDYDILSLIIEYLGQPADELLDLGKSTEHFFCRQSNSKQRWRFKALDEFDGDTDRSEEIRSYSIDDIPNMMEEGHRTDVLLLVDLIKKTLQLVPKDRPTSLEALQHPFFSPASQKCLEMNEDMTIVRENSQEAAEPEDVPCQVDIPTAPPVTTDIHLEMSTQSSDALAARSEEESSDVPLVADTANCLCFSSVVRWIGDNLHHIVSCFYSRTSYMNVEAAPENIPQLVDSLEMSGSIPDLRESSPLKTLSEGLEALGAALYRLRIM